jgi:signal transduction histidine kinase
VRGTWDRLRLDQVISNLLANAIKYGGGAPIEVEVAGVEDRARLVVRDRGIGVAPEDHAKIFERFERVAPGRRFSGLGLGLWIVRKIVEASGGSIEVDSQLGKGAAFVVDLPRGPSAA